MYLVLELVSMSLQESEPTQGTTTRRKTNMPLLLAFR